jgi:hypothetical protein
MTQMVKKDKLEGSSKRYRIKMYRRGLKYKKKKKMDRVPGGLLRAEWWYC